jgi:hypothetical protein
MLALLSLGSDSGSRRGNSAFSYKHLNFDVVVNVTLIKKESLAMLNTLQIVF